MNSMSHCAPIKSLCDTQHADKCSFFRFLSSLVTLQNSLKVFNVPVMVFLTPGVSLTLL